MHRARSATAIQTLSHNRHDSINEAVSEVPMPPARILLERSGSEALPSNHPLGTPGLKDVLKVRRKMASFFTLTNCYTRFHRFPPSTTLDLRIFCHHHLLHSLRKLEIIPLLDSHQALITIVHRLLSVKCQTKTFWPPVPPLLIY
jgi:hypothetical protein